MYTPKGKHLATEWLMAATALALLLCVLVAMSSSSPSPPLIKEEAAPPPSPQGATPQTTKRVELLPDLPPSSWYRRNRTTGEEFEPELFKEKRWFSDDK